MGELVVHKVDRPARIRHSHRQQRRPRARRPLSAPTLAHRQAFFAIKPLRLLAVHDMALPSQQNMQPPVAEPAPLGCQRLQALAQIVIIWASAAVSDRGPVRADHGTRPPLAHLVALHEDRDGFTPGGGRYHSRDSRSFNAAWSSSDSAGDGFSRAFSSSRAFSRLASDTSMPPNLAFQA